MGLSISKIGNYVGGKIANGIAGATNLKPAKWLGDKFDGNLEKALATAVVGSIIAKDGIGCAMYVTQSMNNKKIPDEKRKFVAALDLTNGLLMIVAQIGMFLAMRKYSGAIFNKLFDKSFNPIARSNNVSRMRMWMGKKGETVLKKLGLEKIFDDKVQKGALDVFKFVLDTAAATIVGKRVIVPLIATPFASKVEKWLDKREKMKNGELPAEESDKSTPSMKGNEKVEEPAQKPAIDEDEITNLLDIYKKNHTEA
ncbi:hypothetical protein IJ674_03965 [bacterium]|nr:hypothetical protein [bacterium]